MTGVLSGNDNCQMDENDAKRAVFLLTKPPHSERMKLCFRLIEHSKNAVLYLAGDGVYNLMNCSIEIPPKHITYACKEDMNARGVPPSEAAISLENFYDQLVEDVMLWSDQVYAF